ncbi:MAG: hypothetical protein AAGP08_17570, partial [Pseudomonadota bacterium]
RRRGTLEEQAGQGLRARSRPPHKSWGMVGLLLVGDVSVNYEAAKTARQRGKAKANFAELFAEADALLAEEAQG